MAESDRALLVLDMLADRLEGPRAIPGAAGILRFVQGELRYFRERGRPVLFACTRPWDAAGAGPEAPEIMAGLTPRADERVVWKVAPSAFFQTDLHRLLQSLGVKRLTLVGLETHTSVLLTAADALAHGLQVVVPDPCVCATRPEDHAFSLRLIREEWPRWAGAAVAEAPQAGEETGARPRPLASGEAR